MATPTADTMPAEAKRPRNWGKLRPTLLLKLMLVNIWVIGIAMLVVWLSIDILAADYTTQIMKEFNVLPVRTHWVFISTVHRYLLWSTVVAVSLAAVFCFLLTRRVLQPLSQMREVAGAIAAGDYSRRATVTTHDEISELAGDLNRMADSLERIEQLRRDMVADVAHELRTPLTNMRGYLEGILDGVVPADAERLRLLHDESLRLAKLVDDLMRLAEADAAAVSVRAESVDLGAVIDGVVGLVQPRADRDRVVIETRVDRQAACVVGDADKLMQIVHNLLDNAVGYSPPAGVVTVAVGWSGTHVRLAVENVTAVPPPADFALNFERFHRGEKSRSRQYGGAGIGLAIVKKLVEAQGGTVRAEVDGNRVRVVVLLPRA